MFHYLQQKWILLAVAVYVCVFKANTQSQILSLKESINYSLQHHPSSTIYKYSAQSAAEKIRESKSTFLPSVWGSIGLDYNMKLQTTIIPAGSFSPTETKLRMGNRFSNFAYIQLDQNIFDRSSALGIKTAKINKEIADLNVLKQNQILIYNTASAYYQALVYVEKGKLLKESEKQYDTIVGILKLRYELGTVKKSEYDRARVNYNNVQLEIQANNSAYRLALNTLKNNIGLDLEASISIEDTMSSMEMIFPSFNIGSSVLEPDQVIDYRIDQKNMELNTLDVQQKKAAFLPTISIYGKYGGNAYGSDFLPALGNWFDYSSVGLKANIPIFSGLKKKSQLEQSKLNLASQELTNKLNLQTYKLNLENASTQLVSAYTNLKKSEENLQLAREMMDASTIEYAQGITTLSSLMDAEYSLKEARSNYTTSLLDYLNARLNYYNTTGSIAQFLSELK
jgi:outer membrane protein